MAWSPSRYWTTHHDLDRWNLRCQKHASSSGLYGYSFSRLRGDWSGHRRCLAECSKSLKQESIEIAGGLKVKELFGSKTPKKAEAWIKHVEKTCFKSIHLHGSCRRKHSLGGTMKGIYCRMLTRRVGMSLRLASRSSIYRRSIEPEIEANSWIWGKATWRW